MPSSKRKYCQSKQHIKRPANSFMLWAQITRPIFFKHKPRLNNSAISKLLGQLWNILSSKDKQIYKDKALKVKLEHKAQYPNYIFSPKKKIDTIKKQTYIPLIINANKQIKMLKTQAHAHEHAQNYDVLPSNDNILPSNFNVQWINYKEDFDYYETIELFYSKL